MEDCGVEIGDFNGIGRLGLLTGRVGFTEQQAIFQATAADQAREAVGPVVASTRRVDVGCPPELADHQHDRRLQEVSFGEVFQKRGQTGVEILRAVRVRFEIAGVRIEAVQRDLNRANALFQQPPRHETALAERAVSIGRLDGGGFVLEVEGSELLGAHHAQRGVDRVLVQRLINLRTAIHSERFRDGFEVLQAAFLSVTIDIRAQVLSVLAGVEDAVGVVAVAEKSAARREVAVSQRNELRNLNAIVGQFVSRDGTDARMNERRFGTVSCLEHVRPSLVIPFFRHH